MAGLLFCLFWLMKGVLTSDHLALVAHLLSGESLSGESAIAHFLCGSGFKVMHCTGE